LGATVAELWDYYHDFLKLVAIAASCLPVACVQRWLQN
jgi:hypothetical protein